MISHDHAWAILGIEPTGDSRAIRTAYARALKAIDVEADPQAFIALREAFEAAQSGAIRQAAAADERSATADAEPAPREPALVDMLDRAPPSGEAPQAESHPAALERMLYGDYVEREPTLQQAIAMRAHWDAILADPRMQEIGHYGDVERWASELIANTIPFSNPLVVSAVNRFGWHARAGSIHQSPAASFLVARALPLSFANGLLQPGHPLGPAWRELTSPTGPDAPPFRGHVSPIDVHKLASRIAREYPELWSRFDPGRLKLWGVDPAQYRQDESDERNTGRIIGYTWMVYMIVLGVVTLIGLIAGLAR